MPVLGDMVSRQSDPSHSDPPNLTMAVIDTTAIYATERDLRAEGYEGFWLG